ncbi:serine O-acetyltransferase EpsC [Chitinivibrio alkaliphilus]|uniref:Serine O-acetyltransferase n=1 Tax=Chitinivibrio alkaliphilus ACht1 TaxID=1313304 RepID=U7D3U2_9BACT|nr:serine O-acetyltransferase EpsC [Chitinivibrio alkaliphilus]ERP31174.1 Serine O-acetyltransferase [Chitinivibrio alkaliphilus ACht1]
MIPWINSDVPQISKAVLHEIGRGQHIDVSDGLNMAGRKDIYDIHDGLLSIFFPGVWSRECIEKGDVDFYITCSLRRISHKLVHIVRDMLLHHSRCNEGQEEEADRCYERASQLCRQFIAALPQIRRVLVSDIETAYSGDPAAVSRDEILLSYPFVEAVATYRLAHELYELKIPIVPRILSERAHSNTGIDIHPGAQIGDGFFIDHGTGVVIGETCRIGKNVKIYQGVTLGATSPFDESGTPRRGVKRHPDVGDNVIIYANAVILGGDTVIGENSIIGGNAWVTEPVPPNSVVFERNKTEMRQRRY